MIKKLRLENFQSHKNSELEFVPGVNIIIGGTDSGKSAIIKAIRWILTNKPSGDDYRSHWAKKMQVDLVTEECEISRIKSTTDNAYLLHTKQGEGMEFRAFGTEVPVEVRNILNFDKTNLQHQFDSHFLLSDTPGEVASHFNRIAHLDLIDESRQKIEKALRELKAKQDHLSESIESEKETYRSYFYLEKAETDIEGLEKLFNQKTTYSSQITQAKGMLQDLEKLENKITGFRKILKIENPVNSILELLGKSKQEKKNTEEITLLNKSIEKVDKKLKEIEHFRKAKPIVDTLIAWKESRKQEFDQIQEIKGLLKEYSRIVLSLTEKINQIDKLEEQWYESFPDICPLCGK